MAAASHACRAGAVALLMAAGPARAVPPAPAPETLVEVRSETLIIGPNGTRTRASDRALLSPGKAGLLRVELSLPYGVEPPREHVSLELRVRLGPSQEPRPAAGAAPRDRDRPVVRLAIDSTARVRPEGEVVMRTGGGETDLPGSLFYEAYASAATGERVVVHLKLRPWEEDGLPPMEKATRPIPVAYKVWVYRRTIQGLDAVAEPELASVVGHAARYAFGFTLGGEGGAREQLEVRILGVEVRDGVLTGTTTLHGTLVGAPVRRESGWSLAPGEATAMDVSLESLGGEELGFHVVILADFDPN